MVARLRLFGAAVLALSLSLHARTASAADSSADDARLEAQIQQGIALRRAGNDEGALALFLDLERSNPDSVRVLLHITTAAQATGRWLMAYSYLKKTASQKNDPYFVRYRSQIKSIEDATAQHVGQFRALGSPAGAEVRLNGEVVGTLPMSEPKPIEVGQYVLEVTKLGFYPLRRSVSVGPGTTLTQEAVELRGGASPAESLGSRGAGTNNSADSGRNSGKRPWWHARWVSWSLAGATVVTGGASVAALLYRNDRADRWNSNDCLEGNRTRAQVCGDIRDCISLAEGVAVGTGIAAGVFAVATVTQLALSKEPAPTANAKAPAFKCAPGLGSVLCYGTF